jgi:nucleoredoxin
MGVWTELFGSHLVTKDGAKTTEDALGGKKVVGLYFSAHWCPPCRAFTPFLGQTYEDLVEEHSDVELVFVSSDQNLQSFQEYYGEMPFLALPYENREAHRDLSVKFGVRGIPTLVFLNEKGELITTDGRMWVADAQGDVEQLYTKLTA